MIILLKRSNNNYHVIYYTTTSHVYNVTQYEPILHSVHKSWGFPSYVSIKCTSALILGNKCCILSNFMLHVPRYVNAVIFAHNLDTPHNNSIDAIKTQQPASEHVWQIRTSLNAALRMSNNTQLLTANRRKTNVASLSLRKPKACAMHMHAKKV